MSTSTSVGPHIFWILSRGAGTTALVLSRVTVAVGLLMGGGLGGGVKADRRIYHEVLSLSVMVATAVHGLVLAGDDVLHPGLLDVTVPFAWSYMRLATTLGIVAGWTLIALGLSFYVRDRIGRARWKVIHRFTLLAWAAGLVHTIVEGTDVGTLWYTALLVITTAPVLALLAVRIARAPEDFGLLETEPAQPASPPDPPRAPRPVLLAEPAGPASGLAGREPRKPGRLWSDV
jgi:methionine sulfoxide reductase heme-binding subunit